MLQSVLAHEAELQLQSPLARLPTEIKHLIFGFCFTADGPIVDPKACCSKTHMDSEVHPPLGVALLQTCRRLYMEVDRRPLFSQNVFRFTTVDRMRDFLQQPDATSQISDMEIDFRRLNSDQPDIAREWLHTMTSLRTDTKGWWIIGCELHGNIC